MQGPVAQSAALGFEPHIPRILVIDDEPSICVIVQKTLSLEPYAVEYATNPLEGLRRLRETAFDLLITDISMPYLDGLTLAEQVRAAQPLLGIVVMTAYSSFENIARAVHTGIADFITKPFDIQQLRLTVSRALERQRLQRDNVRLHTLVKIVDYSQAINSSLELDALARVVADIVVQETGATAFALWTSQAAGQLVLQPGAVVPDRLHLQALELAEQAFAEGRPRRSTGEAQVEAEPGETLMALPLQVQADRIGVLVVAHAGAQHTVIEELLGIIAGQAALAIRNARQYHALRELDRLKSEFIGIASHELRTPLSLVLGYSSLLRNRLSGRERESLQQIIDGAMRIGDIIDDLVNLRRSDLQQHRLESSTFDIWTVVREVVAELTPLAKTRQVNLSVECPPAATEIVADREKLSLALANVVDNATKFTPAGGSVRVVGQGPEQLNLPQAVIEVHDTGVGIAERDLSRVFERFYQVAPTATRAHTGLGIGLAITKIFVELHGGQVQVQSELGQGSVFQVRLPLVPAEPSARFCS